MRVTFIGVVPHSENSYSTATLESDDGTKLEIRGFLSESIVRLVEKEAIEVAGKRFAQAAQETNLLLNSVIEAG